MKITVNWLEPHPEFDEDQQSIYDERVCIMREGNRIPHDSVTPAFIEATATQQALTKST